MTDAAGNKSRTQLVLMLVIAAVSLFGSYFLFLAVRDGSGLATTNNGAFVTPPLAVEDLALTVDRLQPVDWSEHWWLVTVAGEQCDSDCSDTVHLLRQMHILLNKDSDRVRRALIVSGASAETLREGYPELAMATLPALQTADGTRALAPGVYIVDPLGNFVFQYPLAVDGSAMLKDLKKLLKVSQIG